MKTERMGLRNDNTYEGIYSYKDVLALPTRGAEIGCWKAVAETATDAATMIAVDFMLIMILSEQSFYGTVLDSSRELCSLGISEEDCVRAFLVCEL